MAPVTLPLPNPRVYLPPVPQDPPSHQDVTEALLYVERAQVAYRVHNVTAAVLSEAVTYQTKVVSAKIAHSEAGAVAPPWLQPALNQIRAELQTTIHVVKTELQTSINGLQTSINGLQTSIDELRTEFEEKVDRFDERLISIERTCAISHNMSVADGQNINFKRVPFIDGSDPVVQHNLPPLNTTADIRGLTENDLKTYYIRYVGPVGNRVKETQIKGVCKAIGAAQ